MRSANSRGLPSFFVLRQENSDPIDTTALEIPNLDITKSMNVGKPPPKKEKRTRKGPQKITFPLLEVPIRLLRRKEFHPSEHIRYAMKMRDQPCFKHSFHIKKFASVDLSAYSKIESWKLDGNDSDCCSWDGVECDHDTGRVIGLNLSSSLSEVDFAQFLTTTKINHISNIQKYGQPS
ncbi:hypothetical protein RHMOL_Rhmol04G0059800 [Rhododendron molle]|uniref:Uncharacterized protein n=1 Tax=Rhododendron molle TaxID=49168 RepID=A0ACC0NZ57_RHOML|nr:hypothetical protein RHMOL_Rhmol04G0059800 [Rhododendron molle]